MGEGALHTKYADSGPVSLSSSALGLLAIQEPGARPLSVGSGAEASMAQKVSAKWPPMTLSEGPHLSIRRKMRGTFTP
jgi:hypothetical protein